MLEVLSSAGALTDLIATGARLVEPDARVVAGSLYAPPAQGVSIRTCDPEPGAASERASIVASAETLAYSVATGEVGDPRAFKRPVRVTVPRSLPTDDVLVARKAGRGGDRGQPSTGARVAKRETPAPQAWKAAQTLELVDRAAFVENARAPAPPANGHAGVAVVCATLDEVRDLSSRADEIARSVRAVLAPYIPSALVGLLSAAGIAAIRLDASAAKGLRGQRTIALPAPSVWLERQAITITVGSSKLPLTWLALGAERAWAMGSRSSTRPGSP
jgi:aconitate hydratase